MAPTTGAQSAQANETHVGIGFALAAYTAWGLFPAFWKLFNGLPHSVILSYRIVWAALFFTLLILRKREAGLEALRQAAGAWKALTLSGLLIGANWFMYISAVNSGHVLESSLGYFITPLVNVGLGMVFLRERLRPLQWVALGAALVGIAVLVFGSLGDGASAVHIPLFLAASFGLYGLVRKKTKVPPLAASTVESLGLAIPALLWLIWAPAAPITQTHWLLLVLSGVVTGLPLLWFAEAAKRLPLSTMGFAQFLAPTIQFALAIFVFGEHFSPLHSKSFAFIWLGLALYVVDVVVHSTRRSTAVQVITPVVSAR